MPQRKEFDVCVVGTGAGGGVMIQQLTLAGFDVVALERGPHLATSQFTDDELSTIVRDELFSPDQVETFRTSESATAVRGKYNMLAYCVGGTMTHWAAWSWRFRPDEFKVLSTEGPIAGASLADWPISYDELEPFYEKAEWEFGVSGDAAANPFGAPRKKEYPNPAHPARAGSLRFEAAAKKLGYHPFTTPMAINSRPYGGRPRCLYGGTCQQYGCPVHAKATTYSVCLPRALATGKLDLRPRALAVEILLAKDGRVRGVRYLDGARKEQEVLARHVVVAGNAMGTPHLLLMSKSGSFPQGLANSSGLVGRNLTYHMLACVGVTLDEPALSFTGIEGNRALDDLHASDSKRGFIRGGVVGEFNMMSKQPIAHALWNSAGHPRAARGWGSDFKRFLRDFPNAMQLIALLEDLPMEANRVDLDPDVNDAFGLPAPRITRRQHANDFAIHRYFTTKLLELAEAIGARDKWPIDLPGFTTIDDQHPMAGSAHFHGTCRMGDDPKKSVVDRWCRAHDVPNLWVVDGSFFPTSGGYNPTLTILANAYRVADHFVREARKGSL